MIEHDLNNIIVDIHYYNHRICTPDWEIAPRTTQFINFTYVVSGQGEFLVNGVRYTVRGGDLICVQKGSKESANVDPAKLMDCYCVNVLVNDLSCKEIPLPFQTVTHIGIREDIIAYFHEMTAAWLLRDSCYKLKTRAIYMLILTRCYQVIFRGKDNSNTNNRIEMVLQYVLDHYAEPLSVKKMAKMTKLSPLYFGTLFMKEMGQTFRQYLTTIRINQAENLLYSGMYNVSETASECGFSDVFYFSKVFKEHRGVSPSEILKSKKQSPLHILEQQKNRK
ncbi:MAG TPA: AraC family transcriptional regulator [Anaerovoracaceae bacterium]|nr:AraC family transcriptional regulator [Anaerovoracaceae bacterium]